MPVAILKKGPRLVWTLLGALVLVAMLPLLISHYFLIGINKESLETLEKKYLSRSALAISGDLDNLIRSYRLQLDKIAGGMTNVILLSQQSDPFAAAAETGLIETYTRHDAEILALRLVDRNGVGAQGVPETLGAEAIAELNAATRRAIELSGTEGAVYVGQYIYIPTLNQGAIVVAMPILDPTIPDTPTAIGVVEALISLRTIQQRVVNDGQSDVEAFIVDRQGKVLMHSEAAVSVQQPDFSSLRIVQEFMKAPVPVRLTQSYSDGARRVLGTVSPSQETGWAVVVQKEEKRAFASVDRMLRSTIEWGALAIVLAIIVGILFATGISRPIHALAQKTREIAAGNYQQRVDVRSRNEIGDLANNFNVMSAEIEKAIEKLKKAANENHLLFINSIRMLAAAIDAKDPYTRGHSERVARYSMAIGKHVGLSHDDMRHLRISALLHDVGKIGIDDRILRKPGALSDEEFEVMKTHPEKGAAIMGGVPQLDHVIPGMRYHHEKWSGGGYPDNLTGDEIPMQARIVAIADTFDAMTTNRPYQKAMELAYVVDKIVGFGGSRFDPRVVDAFVRAVKAGDIQPEEQVRGAA
ncbi:MAG: HD domain-containing protein [Acidobacteria bacterium]|nr:HD domain-containing protein [Acidobacteriota bacterium]